MPALADSTIIANDQGFVSVKVGQGQVRFRVQERPDGSLLLTPEPVAQAAIAPAPAAPAPVAVAAPSAPVSSSTRDTASVASKPSSAPSATSSAADSWLQVNREAMLLLRGRGPTRA